MDILSKRIIVEDTSITVHNNQCSINLWILTDKDIPLLSVDLTIHDDFTVDMDMIKYELLKSYNLQGLTNKLMKDLTNEEMKILESNSTIIKKEIERTMGEDDIEKVILDAYVSYYMVNAFGNTPNEVDKHKEY